MGRSRRGSTRNPLARLLPRCVAILVLATVVFAAPVGAATGPATESGGADSSVVTAPDPGSEGTAPKSSTTTTTTTTVLDGTTAPTPAAPDPGPALDPTPTAGPPELAKEGVVLPDDSLVAAMAELTLERAKVDLIGQRRLTIAQSIQIHDAKLKRVRRVRKHEQAERLDRAVATYRGQSSGWRLGVITERGLADERAVYLVAAVDVAARKHIKELDKADVHLVHKLKVERSERRAVDKQLDEALVRLNRLLDKLAASNGTITTVDGELVYVPTGPSPVALLADQADQILFRLMLTNAAATADGRWLAARHTLALELARTKGAGAAADRQAVAAAIERDWDVTPPNVLHATLFALRQVGKAYVYATAGPDTFDCSGLTKAAYAQIRLGLPHFSGAQLHLGIPVPPEALRPGDLLAYGPDGSEHVTMAIGGGLVVEAKGRAYGVIVAPARVDPLKGFAGATRIVP
jgi:cell wall-associated NlpC family hydrolase